MESFAESFTSFLLREIVYSLVLTILVWGLYKISGGVENRWKFNLWFLIILRLFLPLNLPEDLGFINFHKMFLSEPAGGLAMLEGSGALKEFTETSGSQKLLDLPFHLSVKGGVAIFLMFTWFLFFVWFVRRWFFRVKFYSGIVKNSREVVEIDGLKSRWSKTIGVRRGVKVVTSGEWHLPFTKGVWKPVIYIPQKIMMNVNLINSVIAHEIAHIKRIDALWLFLQKFVQLFYFFNPIIWYVSGKIGDYREMACDDMVINSGKISPRDYGMGLIYFSKEKRVGFENNLSFGGEPLTKRVENICTPKRTPEIVSIFLNFLFILLGISLLPASLDSGAWENIKGKFCWPVQSSISCKFGKARDPFTGKKFFHKGLDLKGSTGTPVKAAAFGVVQEMFQASYDDPGGSRGNYVIIKHPNGFFTKYYHLHEVKTFEGNSISKGEIIGTLGSSGRSTGPHLHFEILKDKKSLNPLEYLR